MFFEDEIPINEVIAMVNKEMEKVHAEIRRLNLGVTEIKNDGLYRIFNDGVSIKICDGDFSKVRVSNKQVKLF